jgi:Flp pilus assembly protein TadD
MKKWIGVFAALYLLAAAAPAFADHIKMVDEPKGMKNKEAKTHFEQGEKAFKKHDFSEAAKQFQAAAQAEPNIPELHVDTALALAAGGQNDMAKKEFDQAVGLLATAAKQGSQKKG